MNAPARSLLPAVLLATAGCAGPSRDPLPEVVATVDGEAVTAREFRLAVRLDEWEREGLSPGTPEELRASRRAILDGLIEKRLLAAAARKRGVRITEEEVERAVLRLRADWPGESFERLLAEGQLGLAELKARLRDRLVVEKLFAEEVLPRVAVTDAEVDARLAERPAPAGRPERVRASQIVVKTEAEAERLREELARGKPFAELARRHSLSPDARAGGDLGWFARGEMPPEFEAVCFTLPPGKTSGVVASPYGYHLFQVVDRRDATVAPAGAARAAAETELRRAKEARAQEEYLARLRTGATIEIDEAAFERLVRMTE